MRIALLALLGGALFASPARGAGDEAFDGSGEAVVPGGGTVSFTGASSTNWVGGELVLVYTNAATFTLPGTTKARVLAVGGGGGGGGSCRASGANATAGGGGGGGGVAEADLLLSGGDYAVAVGAGGAGGKTTRNLSTVTAGGSGGASSVAGADGAAVVLAQGGGGGGGGAGDGLDGGSGGGAGKDGAAAGAGEDGQGFGGGAAAGLYGGGGGGAGAAGSGAADGSPAGGAGKSSDITGASVTYGGGGGGGYNKSGETGEIAGGDGGGGAGGYGGAKPGDGADGLGGGGGGNGNANGAGGAGGAGVVVVRIASTMRGEFVKPTDFAVTYDGHAHTSLVENVYYTVSGQAVGTDAGTYVATATLRDGATWPDGTDEAVTVTMTILKASVTLSDLKQDGWAYGTPDGETPAPSCTTAPAGVFVIYEYADSAAGPWNSGKPTALGTHYVRVRVADSRNYADNAPAPVAFEITRCTVTFADLRLRDWMQGTPAESTPDPTCTVTPRWVTPVYEYGTSRDGADWSAEKPTAVGSYWVRASAPDATNYDFEPAYAEFQIVRGLGNLYTDYVEITLLYTASGAEPAELLDFPFEVTLSEERPVGFLYSRAGATGDEIAFTDAAGDSLLPYHVAAWDTNGTSTVYVKVPRIESGVAQTIRLYWHLRPAADAPAHDPGADWTAKIEEARGTVANPPDARFEAPVYRDGLFVNYWTRLPAMDKTWWDSEDPEPGKITQEAALAFGSVRKVITNVVAGVGYETLPTRTIGSYRVLWTQADGDGYEPISCYIDFVITGHDYYDGLGAEGAALTRSGRVFLANDDTAAGHAVDGQGYWREREVARGDGTVLTNDLFWTHAGTHDTVSSKPYLLPGTSHRLVSVAADGSTNVLWRFENVLFGNQFRSETAFADYLVALPWSPTALAGTTYATRDAPMGKTTSVSAILRNVKGACVYSPCYTNGIGTIYFDAANGVSDNTDKTNYRIAVEVATATDEGKAPTDANAAKADASGLEGELGLIGEAQWVPCWVTPLKRDGGATFERLPETNDLALAITTGGSTNNFYRICAKVNVQGPARFRIRRLEAYDAEPLGTDGGSLILLDNIVVSPAPNVATVEPYGTFDATKRGKQYLGQAGAMSVPFPSVADRAVYGRAKAKVYLNGLKADVDPASCVSLTRMHYQWTYLGQASNDWQTVALSPSDGLVATTPLNLPAKEGDVSWWYESVVQVPTYKYYDYSGLGAGLAGSGGSPLYTEEVTSVTNRSDSWFFRLRPGRSSWEGFQVIAKASETGAVTTVEMELVGNGLWRGYYQTAAAVEDGLSVRFVSRNEQVAGAETYETNETFYVIRGGLGALPGAGTLDFARESEWTKVVCDAKTGYLLFLVDESTRGVSVVRADYQDFNRWDDANKPDFTFVGTSTDTNSASIAGVASTVHEYEANLARWWPSSATNATYWTETFQNGVTPAAMGPGGDWEINKPFTGTRRSPNGFTVGPGQWVAGAYRDTNTGMALQMTGDGVGYVQFVNAAATPRGLESVRFNARLGQAIDFDDFSYYDGGSKAQMTNYTFVTRAAYDLNQRRDFVGNGSLSLVAFYRPGVGAYEFRVEQKDANLISGQVQGPGRMHRLSLLRWRYNGKKVVATELGAAEVDGGMSSGSMLTTMGKDGNYGLLFISVQNDGTKTTLSAGVSTGVASANTEPTSAVSCQIVSFVDAGDERLTGGTYGVLAANCPGRFVHPVYGKTATRPPTAKTEFTLTAASFTYPTGANLERCQSDLQAEGWYVCPDRAQLDQPGDSRYYGLVAKDAAQPLNVYTAPLGTTDWTLLATTNVTKFAYFDEPIEVKLWNLADCAVKIEAGEGAGNDVVIDDLELRQWRGESYDEAVDGAGVSVFDNVYSGSPSNVVFTQGWILTNLVTGAKSCELNAKRSRPSVATSIRSPLMDGVDGRGLGLGMFTFTYTNAQPNARLLLQVCTNGVDITTLAARSKDTSSAIWTTVTNYTFDACTDAERLSGRHSYYFGLHGVKGVMRLCVDPELVRAVSNVVDEAQFGSVEITGVLCRDAPALDKYSWWGWNLRTTGEADKLYLFDSGADPNRDGMALALNNSVSNGVRLADERLYPEHLPFVQTPTFDGEVVGEVSFKARRYDLSGDDDAIPRVTLFGLKGGKVGDDDTQWQRLAAWNVTNALYQTFTHKTGSGDNYCAFRLAVTGVENVKNPMPDDFAPSKPLRVLIDEVVVMEAIRGRVAFRNVAAFRSGLDETTYVKVTDDSGALLSSEQPLCKEAWGVQAEVYASQLADEVDLSDARVRLWWHAGISPWGFENWKAEAERNGDRAWLMACKGTNLVYRSSYFGAPDAVMAARNTAQPVQYMLEVVYRTSAGEAQTNWLAQADWEKPAWYNPVDLNAQMGRDGAFSAYTILDTVSPGWAWFNEVNIFGEYDWNYQNSDLPYQFLEVAAPSDADLSEWSIRLVDAKVDSGLIVTNEIARFGSTLLPGLKKDAKNMDPVSKCVFHVVASPNARATLDADKGEIDGVWNVPTTRTVAMNGGGALSEVYPIAVQLVRPSGVIEHEVVAIGTNNWALALKSYDPEEHLKILNEKERAQGGEGKFFFAGMDAQGGDKSLGVFTSHGESEVMWNATMSRTPGSLNAGQIIPDDCPRPNGTGLMIYASITNGHLRQSFDGRAFTNATLTVVYRKGAEEGTNLLYRADRWYELGDVTVDGVAATPTKTGAGAWSLEVGKNVSNSVITVIAASRVASDLVEKHGLGPENPYRDAVLDWLSKGQTMKWGSFHDPDTETLGLADFVNLGDTVVTNLPLTAMYWLDMDPTWPDHTLRLKGDLTEVGPYRSFTLNGIDYTNDFVRLFMMITNTATAAAWTPYVLQSATPGVTSRDYAAVGANWNWSNVTFKVTGLLMNAAHTASAGRNNRIPLRYFVFAEDSFAQPGEANAFTSFIEIDDPYSTWSPGYSAGWYDWAKTHGREVIGYAFDIDDRLKPVTVEILKKENLLEAH